MIGKEFRKDKLRTQNKGQSNCSKAFIDSIKSGAPSPISFDEIIEVARVSVNIAEMLRK